MGAPETLLADAGYFSAANVAACAAAGIEPLIAMGRQPHHPALAERFDKAPSTPDDPTPVEAMAHRLQTPEGKKLYAKRKHTPEPVFGIIKSILGFRQFLLRGLEKVKAEWTLVTLAWNMKRMFALRPLEGAPYRSVAPHYSRGATKPEHPKDQSDRLLGHSAISQTGQPDWTSSPARCASCQTRKCCSRSL